MSEKEKSRILYLFWSNVDWHRNNKELNWVALVGGNTTAAKNKTANITLKKVEEIAKILDIDDYGILFEDWTE